MTGVRSGFLSVLYGGNATSHAAKLSVGDRGVGCSRGQAETRAAFDTVHVRSLRNARACLGRSRATPTSRGSTLRGRMAGTTIKAPRSTGSGGCGDLAGPWRRTPSRAIEHGPYRPDRPVARTRRWKVGRMSRSSRTPPNTDRQNEREEEKNYSLGDKYLLNRLRGKQKG